MCAKIRTLPVSAVRNRGNKNVIIRKIRVMQRLFCNLFRFRFNHQISVPVAQDDTFRICFYFSVRIT